jgi:pimeloyl-ACP methyl ester carboxylesterase
MNEEAAFKAADAVFQWILHAHSDVPKFLWGFSLGGAFAAYLASKYEDEVRTAYTQADLCELSGCIFDNTFLSTSHILKFRGIHIPLDFVNLFNSKRFSSDECVVTLNPCHVFFSLHRSRTESFDLKMSRVSSHCEEAQIKH